MDIIKLIRDFNFDEEQMRFVEYLRNVEDVLYCEEEIKNSQYLSQYYKSKHEDLNIYNNTMPGASPKRLEM